MSIDIKPVDDKEILHAMQDNLGGSDDFMYMIVVANGRNVRMHESATKIRYHIRQARLELTNLLSFYK